MNLHDWFNNAPAFSVFHFEVPGNRTVITVFWQQECFFGAPIKIPVRLSPFQAEELRGVWVGFDFKWNSLRRRIFYACHQKLNICSISFIAIQPQNECYSECNYVDYLVLEKEHCTIWGQNKKQNLETLNLEMPEESQHCSVSNCWQRGGWLAFEKFKMHSGQNKNKIVVVMISIKSMLDAWRHAVNNVAAHECSQSEQAHMNSVLSCLVQWVN